MIATSAEIGDRVQPRDPAAMLAICDTYHSGIAYGVVVDIYPKYSASLLIAWFDNDFMPQSISYLIEPELLSPAGPRRGQLRYEMLLALVWLLVISAIAIQNPGVFP